jgi:predicted metallopeptidase
MKNNVCASCSVECEGWCAALEELQLMYNSLRNEERVDIIRHLRQQLGIRDAEVADDLRELAEKIIEKMPELSIIPEFEIKVGYVRSFEKKQDKSKLVYGDCRRINKVYGAYLPYDFIITFYEPHVILLSENQRKILMLHELKHIGIGERGLRIEYHDVQDFGDILQRFGIDWNWFEKEVPDILV